MQIGADEDLVFLHDVVNLVGLIEDQRRFNSQLCQSMTLDRPAIVPFYGMLLALLI